MARSSIDDFRENGVAVIRQALSAETVLALTKATDELLADPHPEADMYEGTFEKPISYGELQAWKRCPTFERVIRTSKLAQMACEHMGSSKAQFYYDQLLVKEPGSKRRTPWHQDLPYWNVVGRDICSLWLALDPIPKEASLEFVKGTQSLNEHNPTRFTDGTPYQRTGLTELPDIENNRNDFDIVRFALEPGDAIIFHANIVHGAPGIEPNAARRRAYATRWLGDDALYLKKPGERAFPEHDGTQVDGHPYMGDDYPIVFRAEEVS